MCAYCFYWFFLFEKTEKSKVETLYMLNEITSSYFALHILVVVLSFSHSYMCMYILDCIMYGTFSLC